MREMMYLAIEQAILTVTGCKKNPPAPFRDALQHLHRAIDLKESFFSELKAVNEHDIIEETPPTSPLITVNQMISFSSSSDAPSLRQLLEERGLLEEFSNTLATRSGQKYVLRSDLSPEALCTLAACGNLEEIKKLEVLPEMVNTLIDNDKYSAGPELYMGRYNALMIAIAYRQLPVVQYFVENLHANLDIKGGRRNDLSVLDCAGQPGNAFLLYATSFFPSVNLELQNYLKEKLGKVAVRTYREVFDTQPHASESPSYAI